MVADSTDFSVLIQEIDFEIGDAVSQTSNQDVYLEEEEVGSNLRIQRVGVDGRCHKRRRIDD